MHKVKRYFSFIVKILLNSYLGNEAISQFVARLNHERLESLLPGLSECFQRSLFHSEGPTPTMDSATAFEINELTAPDEFFVFGAELETVCSIYAW